MNVRLLIFFLITITAFAARAAVNTAAEPDRHLDLKEVIVRPTKVKYSKKNNPAVDFVEQVMARRHLTDPRAKNDHYNYGMYERLQMGIIDFPADKKALAFLKEYMDTSELSNRPVLNISVKEKVSDVHYRRNPETQKEVVRLRNRHGLDDLVADASSMQTIFEDWLRPVDLYANDNITIMQQRIPSPLGKLATDFYKFYLTDTVADEEHNDSLIVLTFVPHNPSMASFNGRIYVVKGDSAMFIRRAEMRLPKNANLNFIGSMSLLQEYDRAPDGSRLKTLDEVAMEASYAGISAYLSRFTSYNSHNFAQPADTTVFSNPQDVIERNDLAGNVATYRPADMGHGASNMHNMIADMRKRKAFRYAEKTLRTLVGDYINVGGRNARVQLGPLFSLISHNGLEGLRLRGGGRTTALLSPRWFLSGYGAYGFKDKKWKYMGKVEYSFIDKKQHAGEFPVRSLSLSHTYDVDRLGQYYDNSDAFFTSISRTDNNLMTYRRLTTLAFKYETYQHLAVTVSLSHERQEESPYVRFINGDMQQFGHFQQTYLMVDLRFAPGEKFYQSSNRRIPINLDAPVIRLTHTWAPGGVLGTTWAVNKTEFSIDKRWYLSAWGHIDTRLGGGHVWNRTIWPSLLVPNTNVSYFIQRQSFSLMNPLEFVNDSYAELHVTYHANGALLNYIPLIKKLKLREIVGIHGIWGHLSHKNSPARHRELFEFPAEAGTQPMGRVPYVELNVGLTNIFRFFRVDYVRRLTHNGPGLPKQGVRFSFEFTF